MKVWVVMIGEYSDREVLASYSSQSEAEKVADLVGGNVKGGFVLDGFERDVAPDQDFYELEMDRHGELKNYGGKPRKVSRLVGDFAYDVDFGFQKTGARRQSFYRLETAGTSKHEKASYWRLIVRMYARSEEHIIKVANEIRTQILAKAKPEKGVIGLDLSGE